MRFRISAEGSTFIGADDTNGLHIDDISVTNSFELIETSSVELAGGVNSFNFTPELSDQAYLLQVRPQLGGHWFGYGEALAVTSTSDAEPAEVEVSGAGINIVDGDSNASTTDGTDFGRLESGSGALVHVFRVSNVGGSTLNLGTVVSSNSLFTVSNLSSSISAGGFEDFTVTFDPSLVGTQSATISFSTNDSDEDPFNFDVSGEVFAPESDDHGDSAETATNIDVVSSTAGVLGPAGDEDYFRITIANSGEMTVSTIGSTDTYGIIYDATGNALAEGDGQGLDANFSLILSVSAGDYYIRVEGSDEEVTGEYVLETSFIAATPTWMPQGWVYYTWPYAYSIDEQAWYFFDTTNIQWRVDLSDGEWGTLPDATGWNYYRWPYSYSFDQSTWHWYNADTQWVVNLITGVWARLGDSGD